MNVYPTNQIHQFEKHLEALKNKQVMQYNKHRLVEKTTSISIKTNKSFEELDFDFFFNYQIFPSNILIAKRQWETENRTMKVEDTIVQQAFLPPFRPFRLKVIFGVRISEVINEANLKRFSYETIEGHVEKGISSFSITAGTGAVTFRIHTYSVPGNLLTRILAPILTLPYQAYCTRKALLQVKKRIESQ